MPLVTPKRCRAAYVFLQSMPPFDRAGLPDVREIKFELLCDSDFAEYSRDHHDRHCVAVNVDKHTTLNQVLASVAHEMIHLWQEVQGILPLDAAKSHNAWFRRKARIVCERLGFDITVF